MRLLDRLLRRVGLMRISNLPYEYLEIDWGLNAPPRVDIKLAGGQRLAGAVDSYYPNRNPFYPTFSA